MPTTKAQKEWFINRAANRKSMRLIRSVLDEESLKSFLSTFRCEIEINEWKFVISLDHVWVYRNKATCNITVSIIEPSQRNRRVSGRYLKQVPFFCVYTPGVKDLDAVVIYYLFLKKNPLKFFKNANPFTFGRLSNTERLNWFHSWGNFTRQLQREEQNRKARETRAKKKAKKTK